jgi:hypothetical protein
MKGPPVKIRVLKDYDHKIAPARIQAFRAGSVVNVPRPTAGQMIAAGAAEAIRKPETQTPAAED